MTSKPDLHLTVPQPSHSDCQQPQSAIRSPRFREDFDAPFSEALVTPPTSLQHWTASPSNSHSAQSPTTEQGSPTQLRRPSQMREDSWSSSDSGRSTGVNDRIRGWARKSIFLGRRQD